MKNSQEEMTSVKASRCEIGLLAPFALSDPSESPRARPLALGLTLGLAPSPG